MKTVRLFAILIAVLFLMTSCLTATLIEDSMPQRYKSYGYSSVFVKDSIKETDKVLVIFVNEDYQWERIAETAIREELTAAGIACEILSDYANFQNLDMDDTDFAAAIQQTGVNVLMLGGISNIYTYDYGQGVAQMASEYYVYTSDLLSEQGKPALMISIATECIENKFESIYETREKALKNMAETLVKEYRKSF